MGGTDPAITIGCSKANASEKPVTTARYIIDVVMNEELSAATDDVHVARFVAEFQRALDAGFFEDLRYDCMEFTVSREVLHVAPAGG